MRGLALSLTVFLMAVGAIPSASAAAERLRQYFIDYYADFRDENGTRYVLKNRKVDVVVEVEDPVARKGILSVIADLKDKGVTNIEISENRESANLLIKSTAAIREELKKNKEFYQRYFDTPDELESRAASIKNTTACDILKNARAPTSKPHLSIFQKANTKRIDVAYVLVDRLASIPAKVKCATVGVLMAFGFRPNLNSSIPSINQGNQSQFKPTDEDVDALKFLNSDAVKDVQPFEMLLKKLN